MPPSDDKEKEPGRFGVSADVWRILSTVQGHIWPAGGGWSVRDDEGRFNPSTKARVGAAGFFMVLSKLLNIQVPFFFKYAVDGLGAGAEKAGDAASAVSAAADSASDAVALADAAATLPADALWILPSTALLCYGGARAAAFGAQEARNATFATVSQPAVRKMAQDVFEHLHSMDLRFHLDRQTGALTRALDRGSRGINFIMSAALFNVVPTVLEIGLVSGIMYSTAGWEFAAVTVGTMTAYTLFTINVTQWRTNFRLDMNRLDNEAGRRALDSLLNYETVKYFNNEVCGDVMCVMWGGLCVGEGRGVARERREGVMCMCRRVAWVRRRRVARAAAAGRGTTGGI
jgi:ABC-type multidrug transport system fused ATPase/permease subunit